LQLQLAAAALEESPPQQGILIARGGNAKKDSFAIQFTFRAPTPEEARAELARLWQLRQAWRSSCWPVPPETGWKWMEKGCPDDDSKDFGKVVECWEGSGFSSGGEREREEMQICFGSQRTLKSLLEDLAFGEQAQDLLGPIWKAVLSAKEAGRR
jgi:exodeoxyribonuclease V gamma subunit